MYNYCKTLTLKEIEKIARDFRSFLYPSHYKGQLIKLADGHFNKNEFKKAKEYFATIIEFIKEENAFYRNNYDKNLALKKYDENSYNETICLFKITRCHLELDNIAKAKIYHKHQERRCEQDKVLGKKSWVKKNMDDISSILYIKKFGEKALEEVHKKDSKNDISIICQ